MVVVPFVLAFFMYRTYAVPSGSMEPTLREGDRLLVREGGGGDVTRGDVVVFSADGWSRGVGGEDFVKRVLGVGGDVVACCDVAGRVSVNGLSVYESYLADGMSPSRVAFEVKVPNGRLFVLGDARTTSYDSRAHVGDAFGGTIAREDVVGRVERVILPLSHQGPVGGAAVFAAAGLPGGGSSTGLAVALAVVAAAGLMLNLAAGTVGVITYLLANQPGNHGSWRQDGVTPVAGGDADPAVQPPHGRAFPKE
ncbi:signal peptidase I [Streptodolium elevatio]|uniref:Signal peptidase I n=1 Tax=Streptodolium elevatio TaxID=3157996 RepID=A0ABV3DE73_9ACTN